MIWILSRSTSSWSLVRDWAGTPPESPTKSSTLRPAMVALCSLRYCTSARSMSMPPEASGPVFTVIRPRRMGPLCARATAGNPSAEALKPAPAAWMNLLRLNVMVLLLCSVRSVGWSFRGVGLLQWLGTIESVDFHAFAENAHGRRQAGGVDIEELRPEDLGNQADVRDRRRIAVAEPARFAFLAQMRLERLQRLERPVRERLAARRRFLSARERRAPGRWRETARTRRVSSASHGSPSAFRRDGRNQDVGFAPGSGVDRDLAAEDRRRTVARVIMQERTAAAQLVL